MQFQYFFFLVNKWVCDCRHLWLRELFINETVSDRGRPMLCSEPKRFRGQRLVDLSVQDLVQWVEDCPPPCKCSCIDNAEEIFIQVDCFGKNLSRVNTLNTFSF